MLKSEKFVRSRQLLRAALQVALRQKRLFCFPLLNFASGLVLAVVCAAPMIFMDSGHAWTELAHWKVVLHAFMTDAMPGGEDEGSHLTRAAWFYFAAVYLPLMVSSVFFNVAFYHQILKALAGEEVSLRAGLAFACRRFRAILAWSLLAGTVGFAVQMLAERLGWVGRWAMRLVGLGWSIAAVFVIPVMIRDETTNPFQLLRGSVSTLKKTWGETLIAYTGIQLGKLLLVVAVVASSLVSSMLIFDAEWDFAYVMLVEAALFGCALLAWWFFIGTANDIYRCALYVYATEGVVPEPFSEEQMHAAWKVRGGPAA